MSEPTRTYSNAEITVEWRPELCVHCERCIQGLPQVFDLQARPWVNMDGATTAEIVLQVQKCPEGALKLAD